MARAPIGECDAVTGAFSYSGRAIASSLLRSGRGVRTLTGHPERAEVGTHVESRPMRFDRFDELVESLQGCTTLFNTYWVRFPHGGMSHDDAVQNSVLLFKAAKEAGVDRIVHVSITNPAVESPYSYYRGKAKVEAALAACGVSHAVVRPAILFGGAGLLINNIAWLLRRLPVFAIGGDGSYRIRGIHVDDLAELCISLATSPDDEVIDAVGPDRPTFRELVEAIRSSVGSRAALVQVPSALVPPLSSMLGLALRDTLLTGQEFRAMVDGLADTDGPATGTTSILDWIRVHAPELGRSYLNEISLHFRRPTH